MYVLPNTDQSIRAHSWEMIMLKCKKFPEVCAMFITEMNELGMTL